MRTRRTIDASRRKRRIPAFKSVREESTFWDAHSFLDFGNWEVIPYESLCKELGARKERKLPVTIRLEKDLLRKLKDAARRHGIKYQVLVREILWRSVAKRAE